MARSMPTAEQHALPTRVSVLEHGVQELKTGLDGHRGETRAAFSALQQSLERLGTDIASRGNPTNWFSLISAAASTVVIIGAIFGLNEWRINAALQPVHEARISRNVALKEMQDVIVEMRVSAAARGAANDEVIRRIRLEEDAYIRARINRGVREERDLVTKDPQK